MDKEDVISDTTSMVSAGQKRAVHFVFWRSAEYAVTDSLGERTKTVYPSLINPQAIIKNSKLEGPVMPTTGAFSLS